MFQIRCRRRHCLLDGSRSCNSPGILTPPHRIIGVTTDMTRTAFQSQFVHHSMALKEGSDLWGPPFHTHRADPYSLVIAVTRMIAGQSADKARRATLPLSKTRPRGECSRRPLEIAGFGVFALLARWRLRLVGVAAVLALFRSSARTREFGIRLGLDRSLGTR